MTPFKFAKNLSLEEINQLHLYQEKSLIDIKSGLDEIARIKYFSNGQHVLNQLYLFESNTYMIRFKFKYIER